MYIHSFRLIALRRLLEAQLFNQQYQNYEDIKNVPDRLRWCRHHMGLMQKEEKKPFARLMGIGPNSLRAWESDQKRMFKDSWEKYFKGKIKA